MTKPLYEPSTQRGVAANAWGVSQLQRRPAEGGPCCPGPWHYVGDTNEPAFQNGWANADNGWRTLRFRDSGTGLLDIQGVIVGGAVGVIGTPSVVITIPATSIPTGEDFPLPTQMCLIPSSYAGVCWELDPTGDLSLIFDP